MINIIVAYSRKTRVIGKDNKIPWHLPEDLRHFKRLTENNVVVMGRRTFESLPTKFRPLPNRTNVVLTRGTELKSEGIYVFDNLEDPLLFFSAKSIFIIGGGKVYKDALASNLVDRVIATEIHEVYDGDTFFPILNNDWTSKTIKRSKLFDLVEYVQKV